MTALTTAPSQVVFESTYWTAPTPRWTGITVAVTRPANRVIRVHLIGELTDRDTLVVRVGAPEGVGTGTAGAPQSGTVLLDLSALTFVDDAGMAALATCQNVLRRSGWTVRAVWPHGPMLHLLDHAARAGWCPSDLRCTDILQGHRR